MPYALSCSDLTKRFNGRAVVQQVNLSVNAGQFVTLLGPSGCGKTTTLRLIAGFDVPDSGSISIGGQLVSAAHQQIPPENRRVGMVFQEYALFPHLNVQDNIAFGLKGEDKTKRAEEMLALVGLSGLGKRMPYALSGGQQQRVALARALAPQPQILLLDEPFSNLDASLRAQVRAEVRAILKHSGITCVFVTHDQEEALSLSDEVAVMLDGSIAQIAPPQMLYHHPATRFIANFVGEANFLPAEAQGTTALSVLGVIPLRHAHHGLVDALLRPEMLHLSPTTQGMARVLWREFYGHDQRIGLQLADGTTLIARADSDQVYEVGQNVHIEISTPVMVFPR